jgi:hypothetical protein
MFRPLDIKKIKIQDFAIVIFATISGSKYSNILLIQLIIIKRDIRKTRII